MGQRIKAIRRQDSDLCPVPYPDSEPVMIGQYNGEKVEMTAAKALDAILKHVDPMGLEAIICRKILPTEIARIYSAPPLTGWRYYPKAKGAKPFCTCKFCNRGEIRAQRLIKDNA